MAEFDFSTVTDYLGVLLDLVGMGQSTRNLRVASILRDDTEFAGVGIISMTLKYTSN